MKSGPLPIAREGYPFLLISFVLTAAGSWLFWPLGILFGAGFLFCLNFFRDPSRTPPEDSKLLTSPADGTVLKIENFETGPYLKEPHQKVSIFMSPFNVHVNRIPCDGEAKEIHYFPGKFFVASLDKASLENERNAVVIQTPKGAKVAFVQIAGLVARRIVCYLRENTPVSRGERYGMIRFGSRMEVSFPPEWKVLVKPGQKVFAGETGLAEMN
ncbi:MAG: phosphatidylserine decarboxylase family protein [Deltaproteobacteria bacterium]|nr:phosphatidylserine decarboxylase family protein [Deltaproteobacteria bacterium]